MKAEHLDNPNRNNLYLGQATRELLLCSDCRNFFNVAAATEID